MGSGLLSKESAGWPPYFAVSSPSAYKAARPYLSLGPRGIEFARWLDWSHLQEITDKVPDDAELIVGIGGGTALDASKYVALKKGLPLILVPTVVSTGAIIHSVFAEWEGHKTIGPGGSWPWIDFDHVVVDYELTLQAPHYLNTAGLGDVLCGYSGIAEWRRNSRLGIGPPFVESAVADTTQHLREIVDGFPSTLSADGALTPASIQSIMAAVQGRDSRGLRNPAAPMGDHPFWLGAEEVTGKTWIHGEFVALGALIIAWHCEEGADTFIGWLDACKVRRRPDEIGVSRDELSRALDYAPEFMSDETRGSDTPSILRTEPIAGARFEALWDYLQAA